MKVSLITPAGKGSRHGNRVTTTRWARFLRQLGHRARIEEVWSGERADVMIALHARRSHKSIERYAVAQPDHPLIVALTGTDLYRDVRSDWEAGESLELASRLVVLQSAGLKELKPRHRAKTRVIYQSAEPVRHQRPAKSYFDVCILGHLRAEKDPFRVARAARLLPEKSRIRILHAGGIRETGLEGEAESLMLSTPRYRWLGDLPRWKTRCLLSRSRLLVQSSIMEGGANAISEALAAEVPVVASYIPGNLGILGEGYPGYYPVGDEKALARLLERVETDAAFYARLREWCGALKHLVSPEREKEALDRLLKETCAAPQR